MGCDDLSLENEGLFSSPRPRSFHITHLAKLAGSLRSMPAQDTCRQNEMKSPGQEVQASTNSAKLPGAYRVLHTADWHLGKMLGEHSRQEEHQRFLAFLLQAI